MDNEDRQYGRKRTKKPKSGLPQTPAEPQSKSIPVQRQGDAVPVAPETQSAPEFPLFDNIPIGSEQKQPESTPEVISPEPTPAENIPPVPKSEIQITPKELPAEMPKEELPERERTFEKPQPRRDQHRPERQGRPERSDRFRPQGERQQDRPQQERQPERPLERTQDKRRDIPQPQRPREKTLRKFGPERGKARVSIIIPAYNEENNIKPLMDQFHEVIARAGNDWEVILVNDGSTDKTVERARDASIHFHWLKVVSYNKNRGLTAALETGFDNARGSIFVFYPADLQYHPQDIPKMVARIDRGADLVAGWKQGKYNKKFVSFVYNRLCRSLFRLKVHDLNSVKAFKKEILDKITLRHDWHRYMVVMAAEAGYVVDEVKVNVYPRHSGKSKFGTGRILGGVLDLISVKFQLSFTKKPFRFFGTWGMMSVLLGIVLGLIGIYLRFFTDHGSRIWLFLVILFVLAGLMLFSLGFLAEVIVALREEIELLKNKKQI
jgi:glycosyltransferase involved in cell wall biosynthesis